MKLKRGGKTERKKERKVDRKTEKEKSSYEDCTQRPTKQEK